MAEQLSPGEGRIGAVDPLSNLLFFAAWPMLTACFALYTLRVWIPDG
jgi:hypothetical protein